MMTSEGLGLRSLISYHPADKDLRDKFSGLLCSTSFVAQTYLAAQVQGASVSWFCGLFLLRGNSEEAGCGLTVVPVVSVDLRTSPHPLVLLPSLSILDSPHLSIWQVMMAELLA